MKVSQYCIHSEREAHSLNWEAEIDANKSLVLAFGQRELLENTTLVDQVLSKRGNRDVLFCSSAGEIEQEKVHNDSITLTELSFRKTHYQPVSLKAADFENETAIATHIAKKLASDDLKHVCLFADGDALNVGRMLTSLNDLLPQDVSVTGGLAGDAERFEKNILALNAAPSPGNIIALGFTGTSLSIGYGSLGGWDTFGLKRSITKAKDNILFELDGKPALELYKKYLGDKAKELPGSALLFPLKLHHNSHEAPVVRTILGVNEETGSMTFAGDMPVGATVQLMRANVNNLVDGAYMASADARRVLSNKRVDFALLVSCVGRRLVLGQRIEEEIEAVQEVIGTKVPSAGFYSYGEIAPFSSSKNCELHNQTMTVTLFTEN